MVDDPDALKESVDKLKDSIDLLIGRANFHISIEHFRRDIATKLACAYIRRTELNIILEPRPEFMADYFLSMAKRICEETREKGGA